MLTTKDGIPIAFHFTTGKTRDAKLLGKRINKLYVETSMYGDSVYTNYSLENAAFRRRYISLKIQQKSNAKRIDTLEKKNEKLKMRKE